MICNFLHNLTATNCRQFLCQRRKKKNLEKDEIAISTFEISFIVSFEVEEETNKSFSPFLYLTQKWNHNLHFSPLPTNSSLWEYFNSTASKRKTNYKMCILNVSTMRREEHLENCQVSVFPFHSSTWRKLKCQRAKFINLNHKRRDENNKWNLCNLHLLINWLANSSLKWNLLSSIHNQFDCWKLSWKRTRVESSAQEFFHYFLNSLEDQFVIAHNEKVEKRIANSFSF